MKNLIKSIAVVGFLFGASTALNAQSVNSPLVVSKGVQQVANKKAFEDNDLKKSNILAYSQPFPATVISKGIFRSTGTESQGNIVSKGYPTWAISKGIARQNQEKIQSTPSAKTRDQELLLGNDVSK